MENSLYPLATFELPNKPYNKLVLFSTCFRKFYWYIFHILIPEDLALN